MTSRFSHKTIATLLTIALIAPSVFLTIPQKAYAQALDPAAPIFDLNLEGIGTAPPLLSAGAGGVAPAGGSGCLAALPAAASGLAAGIAAGIHALGFGTGSTGDPGNFAANAGACLTATMQLIQQSITSAAAVSSNAALIALQFDAYVLQPLAFVLSGNLLKAMTAGTIAFVIGKANGTGLPQFVADIQASLQTVSDAHTLAFFDQYIRNSRSPWNTSIISQLSKEYLNKTSLAGFWAQNMDTLRRTSPNIYGYLNGNWALGGVGAWFALTTQTQNSPYTSYNAARSQLAALIGPGVGGAVGAKLADLAHGGGVASWCGPVDSLFGNETFDDLPGAKKLGQLSTGVASGANATAVDQAGEIAYDKAYNAAIAEEPDDVEGAKTLGNIAKVNAKTDAFNRVKAANAGNSVLGIAPGDPCTNSDGTTGTIKTPGSVILATLNKALGGQQDNVVRMGNVGPQINTILSNIGQVLKTVQFASQILGGPGSGGLFGVDQPTPGQTRSALQVFANSSGNLGATNDSIFKDSAAISSPGFDMLNRVTRYESSIQIMDRAANTALTSVTSLAGLCISERQSAANVLSNLNSATDLSSNFASTSAAQILDAQSVLATATDPSSPSVQAASTTIIAAETMVQNAKISLANFASTSAAQITAVQGVIATEITPVLFKVQTASTTIANARALVQKIQDELKSNTEAAKTAYLTDVQTLQTMPPSATEVGQLEQDLVASTITTSTAEAAPPGSLNITKGALIDRLNLLSTNATTLKNSVCTPPTYPLALAP